MTNAPNWADYRRLQEILKNTTSAKKSLAIEAAMNSVLDAIQNGITLSETQVLNLIANRASRERNRKKLLVKYGADVLQPHPQSIAAEANVECAQVLATCSPTEARHFLLIAKGYRIGEISELTGANENTIRTQVHRARKRLKG